MLYVEVTALSGVSYASVYEQLTPDSVVTLFHDCKRSLWLSWTWLTHTHVWTYTQLADGYTINSAWFIRVM